MKRQENKQLKMNEFSNDVSRIYSNSLVFMGTLLIISLFVGVSVMWRYPMVVHEKENDSFSHICHALLHPPIALSNSLGLSGTSPLP